MTKPNILLLMTDQQRADAMGCSGGWVRTPHIDRIARQGVRFTHCIANAPECMPTRISLATGLYPHNTGVWNNQPYTLPPETPTWLQAVRQAGYRTSLFGKTHHYSHDRDMRHEEALLHAHGLDDVNEIGGPRASAAVMSHMTARWKDMGLLEAYQGDYRDRFENKPHMARPSTLPLEEYADVYVADRTIDYLAAYNRSEPWCCWASFGGPHEPWDAPEPYASMYDPASMPPPLPRVSSEQNRPHGLLDNYFGSGTQAPCFEDGEIEKMRANYAGNITLIDEQIGRILKVIEQRGELENTVIVFTSDHGEMNGDHGLIYKSNFLDAAVRIPLIVSTPGMAGRAQAGAVSDSLVEWFDIGPTLVELAGGEIRRRQYARSLCPVLNDPAAAHRPGAVSEFKSELMYLDHEWKLALNRSGQPYLLIDRQADPNESENLAGRPEMKDAQERLLAKITEWKMNNDFVSAGPA